MSYRRERKEEGVEGEIIVVVVIVGVVTVVIIMYLGQRLKPPRKKLLLQAGKWVMYY